MLSLVDSANSHLVLEWLEKRKSAWKKESENAKFSGKLSELLDLVNASLEKRTPTFESIGSLYWNTPRLFRAVLGNTTFEIKRQISRINYAAFCGEFDMARELIYKLDFSSIENSHINETNTNTTFLSHRYASSIVERITGKDFDLLIAPAHGGVRNALVAAVANGIDFWTVFYSRYEQKHEKPIFEDNELCELSDYFSNEKVLFYDENISSGATLFDIIGALIEISPDLDFNYCASQGATKFEKLHGFEIAAIHLPAKRNQ